MTVRQAIALAILAVLLSSAITYLSHQALRTIIAGL